MNLKTFSRRNFMRAMGSALFLMPFVPQMLKAQNTVKPKRLLIFHTPDGTFPNTWSPLNYQAPSSANAIIQLQPQWNLMHDWVTSNNLQDQIVLVEGLSFSNPTGNHSGGIAEGLTCDPSLVTLPGPSQSSSIDNFVATALGAQGIRPLMPALNLGVGVDYNSVFFNGGQRLNLLNDPQQAFNLLFSNSSAPSSSAKSGPTNSSRRKVILDAVQQQIKMLEQILGSVEKSKLDSHLQSVIDLQNGLNNLTPTGTNGCAPGAAPSLPHNPPWFSDMPTIGTYQMDNIVQSFACDLTRVASIQWMQETTEEAPVWLSTDTDLAKMHGDISHLSPAGDLRVQQRVQLENWFGSQFAYLIAQLQKTEDPLSSGQTLFDNTLIVWTRCLGDGQMHTQYSVSYALSGGLVQKAAGGRYINYGGMEQLNNVVSDYPALGKRVYYPVNNANAQSGQPHSRLMATIATIMGVSPTGFGAAGSVLTPLSELIPSS